MIKHFRVASSLRTRLEESGVLVAPVLRRAGLPQDLFDQIRILLTTEELFALWRAMLGTIAKQKKATSPQIALAWLLAQKPWIVPIPGTTALSRLEENMGSVAIKLTPDDLRDIDSATKKVPVEGDRYPEHLEKLTGR